MATIEVKGLSHWFGDGEARRQVLFDLDLSIEPGENVILTGPSEIPCEFEALALSSVELKELGIEPEEMRRAQ